MKVLEEYTALQLEEEALNMELIEKQNDLDMALKSDKLFIRILELKEVANNINKKKSDMKDKLKESMEKADVKKFENDILTITYVAPTTRKGVDTNKLKTEYEDVYLECIKETPVKSSIRIKVKEVA
ncbi:MAG: hypothetical protein KAX49_07365 [Halanaerobiales bacterium]|nr:hypothetical protein [Halanaerobiales bacterium]